MTTPKPFLKWAGGKAGMLRQLLPMMPTRFNTYHEPFLGAGAVFLALEAERAVISDINPRLIGLWKQIQKNPERLMNRIDELARHQSEELYFANRSRFNLPEGVIDDVERAALFVYLNKTCFNGLYRENFKGEFNNSYCKEIKKVFYDRENIMAVHEKLRHTDILNTSFETILERAVPDDFVYFDPPYVPLGGTAIFTKYSKDDFTLEHQWKLAAVYKELAARGCMVMLSNSDMPIVREMYAGFRIDNVSALRSISQTAEGRGRVQEVVIRNW